MDPIVTGVLLGLVNSVVIAIGVGTQTCQEKGLGILMFGFLPGIMIGAFEGVLAHWMAKAPPWARILALTPIPIAFVFLGIVVVWLDLPPFGLFIPTFVAILVLERVTRVKASRTQLPVARSLP